MLSLWAALATSAAAGAVVVHISETTNISSKITAVGGVPASVRISDVSGDGSVVIGRFSKNKVRYDDWQVFRYTKSGGIENLGPLARDINTLCISADGSVIWGSFYIQNEGSRLFRYTPLKGLQDLGTLGRKAIIPYAASADGSVVVGSFLHSTTPEKKPLYHAFKYSEAHGFEDLGTMGAESAFARGVSADGSVIVGNFHVANSSDHAFRYSRQDGVQDLSAVGGKAAFGTGISNEGVVVGTFYGPLNFHEQRYYGHVFLYRKSGGVEKLGAMGGTSAGKVRISADGTKMLGSYTNSARESYVYIAIVK